MGALTRKTAGEASATATFAIVVTFIWVIAGLVGAAILGFRKRDTGCSVDSDTLIRSCAASEHPYIWAAVAGAAGVLFLGSVALMLASYVKLRAAAALDL